MTAKGKILVIDDDLDVRTTVAEALGDEGYAVAVACNGREALELLLEGARPDVILLDMMMPEMDGWAFRAEQQKDCDLAAIPTLIFTAYGLTHDTAEKLGAQGLLKKPLHLDDLLLTIERARSG